MPIATRKSCKVLVRLRRSGCQTTMSSATETRAVARMATIAAAQNGRPAAIVPMVA